MVSPNGHFSDHRVGSELGLSAWNSQGSGRPTNLSPTNPSFKAYPRGLVWPLGSPPLRLVWRADLPPVLMDSPIWSGIHGAGLYFKNDRVTWGPGDGGYNMPWKSEDVLHTPHVHLPLLSSLNQCSLSWSATLWRLLFHVEGPRKVSAPYTQPEQRPHACFVNINTIYN